MNSYYGYDRSKLIKGRKVRTCASLSTLRLMLPGQSSTSTRVLWRRWGRGERWVWQVEGNEENHGLTDDPSSALGILIQGLIFVIKQRAKEAVRRWDAEVGVCARGVRQEVKRGSKCHLSPSCGSSKQPSPAWLRGCGLSSQAENGPCALQLCSISIPSCLSLVMNTAGSKKSQHIHLVADLHRCTALFIYPACKKWKQKQLCRSPRVKTQVLFYFPYGTPTRPWPPAEWKVPADRFAFYRSVHSATFYERLVKLRLSSVRNLRGVTKQHSDGPRKGNPG